MTESYFVGFRNGPRTKHALLLGVEPKVLHPSEVYENGYKHNVYVRSFQIFRWTMYQLREYLLKCDEHETKFVCLKESFSFDGSTSRHERRRNRNYTVLQCKNPVTGNSIREMLMGCEYEDPPVKVEPAVEEDVHYNVWRKVMDDYFLQSPTNPKRHLYTIEQLAHLHGYSVSSIRRLIEATMKQVDIDLAELKRAKLLRKSESEFKRKKVVVRMQERKWLEAKRHDLKTWMKLVYERLQTIEDEVTRNVKEAKTNIGSMSVDQQSKFFVRNRSIKKTAEKVERIKSQFEEYNSILLYIARRLKEIPDNPPGIH